MQGRFPSLWCASPTDWYEPCHHCHKKKARYQIRGSLRSVHLYCPDCVVDEWQRMWDERYAYVEKPPLPPIPPVDEFREKDGAWNYGKKWGIETPLMKERNRKEELGEE